MEPAAICLTAAVRRTGTRHDRRGPTRRPDRRLARDRRHRRPRSGASTGHCGRTVSTGPRCSSPPSTWGCRPRRPPEATGYSPPCRRCSPAAQGSTWPGRAGRVPVAGQPTASSSRAPISRVSGPRSGAVADQVGGRRRVDRGKCLDEHIWCLVAAKRQAKVSRGEGSPGSAVADRPSTDERPSRSRPSSRPIRAAQARADGPRAKNRPPAVPHPGSAACGRQPARTSGCARWPPAARAAAGPVPRPTGRPPCGRAPGSRSSATPIPALSSAARHLATASSSRSTCTTPRPSPVKAARPRVLTLRRCGDLILGQPLPGQPREAAMTHATEPGMDGRPG